MSKVLVTGGAGFIGSHLVDGLLKKGDEVVVYDDLSSGHEGNLPEDGGLKLVKGSVLDIKSLKETAEGCSEIFHLAEYLPDTKNFGPGHVVKFSYEAPLRDFEVSVRGTLNVLDLARSIDAKVLFTSTAAVYGTPEKVPINEDDRKEPVSPYGMSKYVAEQYCRMYARLYGLEAHIVRIFNTFGPRQRKYVAFDLIRKLNDNPARLELLGTGKESRDFIYVKDTVQGIMLVAEKGDNAQPYNLGNGEPVSIETLARTLCEILGVHPEISFKGESWKGDIVQFYADNGRLKSLGYKRTMGFKDGLEELVRWEKSLTS